MQLVGRSCEVCGERIKSEFGAQGCVARDLAVQTDVCVEDGRCPECGGDMASTLREAEDRGCSRSARSAC